MAELDKVKSRGNSKLEERVPEQPSLRELGRPRFRAGDFSAHSAWNEVSLQLWAESIRTPAETHQNCAFTLRCSSISREIIYVEMYISV